MVSARSFRTATFIALALLVGSGVIALTACGGSSTSGSSSPSATAAPPTPSPSIVPATEPVSRWDGPGSASRSQAEEVAQRYAAALHAESVPSAGLYTPTSTWDIHSSDEHARGAKEIESVYRDAAVFSSWAKGHVLAAPGVGVDEGLFTTYGKDSTPALSLLAVDGRKIAHEEIFINEGDTRPVKVYRGAPASGDTAKAAAQVGAAVGDAFASGDQAALKSLLAPDVMFRDTSLPQDAVGVDAVLAWWDKVPNGVQLTNKKPIAGPGWSVVRWTVRQVYPTGVEQALPGATVMEVRDGQVVRMTVYYNSATMRLQD
jgi:ketosteroid isomerase-like protein